MQRVDSYLLPKRLNLYPFHSLNNPIEEFHCVRICHKATTAI